MGGMLCSTKTKPRDRILESARKLFRRHGLKGIGVEAIAEAAETNKMTLYRHFGSKDDLITECLRDIACRSTEIWDEIERRSPDDPLAQLHNWVAIAADYVLADDRGCDLANAAVELSQCDHPAKKVISEFKVAQRDRIAGLCKAAKLANPDLVADTLALLIEGARINRQSVGAHGPCANFVACAANVIRSAQT